MNSAFIIVGGELDEDPTQVCLPEHDQVVDALPPDRADQSFRKAVLPRPLVGKPKKKAKPSETSITGTWIGQLTQLDWTAYPSRK